MRSLTSMFVACGLLTIAAAQSPPAKTTPSPATVDKAAKLEEFFNTAVERGLFRGAVIVMEANEVIFEFANGNAESEKQRSTVNSSFYLASLSKQFTASAIMVLEQQGKLAFDDLLSKHLAGLPAWSNEVTIRHLLTNTSGLGDYLDSDLLTDGLTNKDVIGYIASTEKLAFTPGERYRYSNSGYVLLARVVEKISGKSFREFTTEHLFKPIGMSAIFNDESQPAIPERVRGYDRYGRINDVPHLTYGAGGLFASARDLVRWNQALFEKTILSEETQAQAFKPMALNNGEHHPYGFGWHVHEKEDGKALHHSGGLAGFRNFMFVDLERQNVVIMLTNGGDSFPLPAMATGVTNILSGRPATVPSASLVDHLFSFAAENPSSLRSELKRILTETPNDFRVDEEDLNALGYAFIEMRRSAEAIGVFESVIDAFPDSANAYDSYAEALMLAKQYEPAVVNYQRSLELDPDNENASEMLRRLKSLMSE